MPSESEESRSVRLRRFLKGPRFKLYCSYALSTWGDRLWTFALSLALFKIAGNLRLTAISGFINGLCVLFVGAIVGNWIDRSKRITAARVTLFGNNASVLLSALSLIALLQWRDRLSEFTSIGLTIAAIGFATLSVIASTGNKIVVTKDWVVVLCRQEKDKLADTNAMLLRIDLTAMILSPMIAGQLMTSFSMVAGCVFIAAWNLCSFPVEYALLAIRSAAIHRSVPGLQATKRRRITTSSTGAGKSTSTSDGQHDSPEIQIEQGNDAAETKPSCCSRLNIFEGWMTYYHQTVFPAALGLSFLYLTVMGLDGITTGYAYSQGLQENVLAIVRGFGALAGISGSFIFPRLRGKIGLARTGLVALVCQLAMLSLSVASIWVPGSPFDPMSYFRQVFGQTDTAPLIDNSTTISEPIDVSHGDNSMVSIWMFLAGLVLARFGLWMADLSISQIMQEVIVEEERGVVNGVQSSIQRFMDLLKNVLVILLPEPETFGLLVLVSFCAVFLGFVCFSVYSRKIRGHILPFHNFSFQPLLSTFERVPAPADLYLDNYHLSVGV